MDEKSQPVLSALEVFAKHSAPIAALLLCVSVFYDFSYFAAIGLTFAEVPTTVADHLRSALVWAPGTVLWVITLTVTLVFARLASGASIAESPLTRHPRTWWGRLRADWPIYAGLLIGVLWGIVVDHSYLVVYLVASGVWHFLAESVIEHPHYGRRFRSRARLIPLLLLVVAPLTVIGIGTYGYHGGQKAVRATRPAWELTIKREGGGEEVKQFVAVRRFSEVAVAIAAGGAVFLVPADHVVASKKVLEEAASPAEIAASRTTPVSAPAAKSKAP